MITELVRPGRTELIREEVKYFRSLTSRQIDVQRAINNNSQYYEKIFDLYRTTDDPEDKLELAHELGNLNQQLSVLHHTKLTQGGTA